MNKYDIFMTFWIVMIIGLLYYNFIFEQQQEKAENDLLIQKMNNSIEDLKYKVRNREMIIHEEIEKIDKLEREINDYKDIIIYKDQRFQNNYDINMNPTYKDVTDFLKEDKTDELEWTVDFDCTQFAHMTVRNAKQKGIYGCIVNIDLDVPSDKYEYSGHDIIVFNTSDAGIVYFEPQNDKYVFMYPNMNYATHLGYSSDYKMWVVQYDSCFERVI